MAGRFRELAAVERTPTQEVAQARESDDKLIGEMGARRLAARAIGERIQVYSAAQCSITSGRLSENPSSSAVRLRASSTTKRYGRGTATCR